MSLPSFIKTMCGGSLELQNQLISLEDKSLIGQLHTMCSLSYTKSPSAGWCSFSLPPQKVFCTLEMPFLPTWSFKDITKSHASSWNAVTQHTLPAPSTTSHQPHAYIVSSYMLFSLCSCLLYLPECEFILALCHDACFSCSFSIRAAFLENRFSFHLCIPSTWHNFSSA